MTQKSFAGLSRDQLMEKGPFLPLSHCPGRWALIPVQLSESRLSKFILVSIFIVPPQINTMQNIKANFVKADRSI